jgi:hypothetical protein
MLDLAVLAGSGPVTDPDPPGLFGSVFYVHRVVCSTTSLFGQCGLSPGICRRLRLNTSTFFAIWGPIQPLPFPPHSSAVSTHPSTFQAPPRVSPFAFSNRGQGAELHLALWPSTVQLPLSFPRLIHASTPSIEGQPLPLHPGIFPPTIAPLPWKNGHPLPPRGAPQPCDAEAQYGANKKHETSRLSHVKAAAS